MTNVKPKVPILKPHRLQPCTLPGGATGLIAVIGGKSIHTIGYWCELVPAGLGAVIMLIVALLVNNIPRSRRYPEFFF